MDNQCGVCGRFRKYKDLVEIGYPDASGIGEDTQLECRECVSEVDRGRYFNKQTDKQPDKD